MEHQVKFKIGEIEFEAAGSAEIIERERNFFLNNLLPVAVDAIKITKQANAIPVYTDISETNSTSTIEKETNIQLIEDVPKIAISSIQEDLERTNLATYIVKFGDLTDTNFVLISAYYDEKRNKINSFSSESVKKYYEEARRPKYSNNSVLLNSLAKKSLIIENTSEKQKKQKKYTISSLGIKYVENYEKKEISTKTKKSNGKRKNKTLISSYSTINADDLNLSNYPSFETFKTFKEKMMLALYIVTSEEKGEYFSTNDVKYIMINILGISANDGNISNVFDRNKIWFNTEKIDGKNKKKLLQAAKSYTESIIDTAKKES